MQKKTIPMVCICGSDAALRKAFYEKHCKTGNPLYILLQSHPDAHASGCFHIDGSMPPQAAVGAIATQAAGQCYDAIWLDCDDGLPINHVLKITNEYVLRSIGKLQRIVRCDGQTDTAEYLRNTKLRDSLTQSDILAVAQSDGKALRSLRRSARALQPNIRVLPMEDGAAIDGALKHRSLKRLVQGLLLIAVTAVLLISLLSNGYTLSDTVVTFLGTYLQALPFLMLGILLSSAIQVFVPADLLQRIFPKQRFMGMIFGVLGGFILPICDCASIPVFRSLVRKGVPLPAAVTFMIAAPIINPMVLLSTYYAFGGNVKIMLARMVFGIVSSVMIGLFFAFEKRDVFLPGAGAPVCACGHMHIHEHEYEHVHGQEPPCACGLDHETAHNRPGWKGRLTALISHFQAEFFEVARFLLIGIAVSTVLQLIMGSRLNSLQISDLALSMLVMMALAFFLSLCSSSDAVVGRNMGTSLPLGAVMSFMVFGPMIDVKNMVLMSASFTKRFMFKLLLATFVVSFAVVYLAFTLGLQAVIV